MYFMTASITTYEDEHFAIEIWHKSKKVLAEIHHDETKSSFAGLMPGETQQFSTLHEALKWLYL